MCHLLNIDIDNSTIKYAVINQSNDFSMSCYFFTISIKLLEVQSFPDVNCFFVYPITYTCTSSIGRKAIRFPDRLCAYSL